MFDLFHKLIEKKWKQRHRRERPLRPEEHATPRLGLALSAGGARGLAHTGVLQVLEENDIEIHAISGSSMGSYVGALWAAGFSGHELEELAAEMHDWRQLWKLADPIIPPIKGLFRGEKARAHLYRSIGDLTFEELERELFLITFDVNSRERLVLRTGSLANAVHASCAMPGIIAPVELNGRFCADGGVVDPIPIGVLRDYATVDYVVAVSVIPTYEDIDSGLSARPIPPPDPNLLKRSLKAIRSYLDLSARGNAIDTLRQSISAAQIRIAHDSLKRADLAILPDCRTFRWNQYSDFKTIIQAGRDAAEEALPAIRELLSKPKHEKNPSDQLVGNRVA